MILKIPLVAKGKDRIQKGNLKKIIDYNVLQQHSHDFCPKRHLYDMWPAWSSEALFKICKTISQDCMSKSRESKGTYTHLSSIMRNNKICLWKPFLFQPRVRPEILKQLCRECFMCWFWKHAAKRKDSGIKLNLQQISTNTHQSMLKNSNGTKLHPTEQWHQWVSAKGSNNKTMSNWKLQAYMIHI